jgi:hypothetical protein
VVLVGPLCGRDRAAAIVVLPEYRRLRQRDSDQKPCAVLRTLSGNEDSTALPWLATRVPWFPRSSCVSPRSRAPSTTPICAY